MAELNETQMQGDFLAQVFGDALGYAGPLDGEEVWHREQHYRIGDGNARRRARLLSASTKTDKPLAVVELKGPKVHLDRHRSNGRTAVGQCWDYLVNTPPECRWGIVSNIVSFRLYERASTKRKYEHFTLQSLRDFDVFKQFYVLFHRQGLIEKWFAGPPRAEALLKQSAERQREVGDVALRGLLEQCARTDSPNCTTSGPSPWTRRSTWPSTCSTASCSSPFAKTGGCCPRRPSPRPTTWPASTPPKTPAGGASRPFSASSTRASSTATFPATTAGCSPRNAVDELELPDIPWTNFFTTISSYDFADEVNLDVLGHLFERSITELEKLKESGLFGDAEKAERYAAMPQSAKRKQLGVYYTPPELTGRIVQYTVEELIAERFAAAAVEFGIAEEEARRGAAPDDAAYWRRCLAILRNLKIVDPACGSGAFLFQAYDVLEARYHEVIGHLDQLGEADAEKLAASVPTFILQENLYGVDLFARGGRDHATGPLDSLGQSRANCCAMLSENIVHGNSLVHDPAVHPAGFDWRERFPDVFNRDEEAGFDCVIGNPPWERMKLQEREFFSLPAPEIATATNAAKRRQLVAKLESDDPALYERYQQALAAADSLLTYCRTSGEYPLTGKGDINTYAVFAELAYRLGRPARPRGAAGAVGHRVRHDDQGFLRGGGRIEPAHPACMTSRTRRRSFPMSHASFKFCILNFGGEQAAAAKADFVFFAHRVEELEDRNRHIALERADIRLLNPNTRTCPIFRTRRDAEITKAIYRRVPVLIDANREGPTGNPWGIQFKQDVRSNERRRTVPRSRRRSRRTVSSLKGNRWIKGKRSLSAAL